MAFTLPDLPYAHDALASLGMSKETFEYHHDIHHKAYVDNGNKLLAASEYEAMSLEDIITSTYQAGAVAQSGLFNNASQHWNHALFWEIMGPGENKKMPGELELALAESFGSVAKFKEDFAAAGAGQFGQRTRLDGRVGRAARHVELGHHAGDADELPGAHRGRAAGEDEDAVRGQRVAVANGVLQEVTVVRHLGHHAGGGDRLPLQRADLAAALDGVDRSVGSHRSRWRGAQQQGERQAREGRVVWHRGGLSAVRGFSCGAI